MSVGNWIGAAAAFGVSTQPPFPQTNDFMSNDYHWADIAEAPRDGTWIVATEMWRGMPISIKVRFAFGAFRDADDTLWEPQYFVKEGSHE